MGHYTYVKYPIRKLLSIRQIVTIHYLTHIRNVDTAPDRHDFWEMVFVDFGQIEIETDGVRSPLHAGEVYFHRPLQSHCFHVGEKPATVFILSFACHSGNMALFQNLRMCLRDKQKQILSQLLCEVRNAFLWNESQWMLRDIQPNPHAPIGAEQMVCNHLEQLLISLLRANTHSDDGMPAILLSKDAMDNRIVHDLKAYIDAHLGERLTLPQLAHQIKYSRAYVCRIFTSVTGMGLMEYVASMRIERAKELMHEGRFSVTQIADALGYASIHYFSRRFKQLVGYTPTQYASTLERRLRDLDEEERL